MHSNQTEGPLDGSLYATITKNQKSSSVPPQLLHQQRSTSSQLIISPPSEFGHSNKVFDSNNNPSSPSNQQQTTKYYRSVSARNTPTPTNFSRQNSYQDKLRYTSNYTPSENISLTLSKSVAGNESYHTPTHQDDSRESVRSPLTLSMDSGISSSGIANSKCIIFNRILYQWNNFFNFSVWLGRIQNSSVSPSSFPSQASPQGEYVSYFTNFKMKLTLKCTYHSVNIKWLRIPLTFVLI